MKPEHIHCSNCNSPARLVNNNAYACDCETVFRRDYATTHLPTSWYVSVEALSVRQYEVCLLLSQGHKIKEVAVKLGTHHTTIKRHLYAARQKLNCKSTWHLTAMVAVYDHELKKSTQP